MNLVSSTKQEKNQSNQQQRNNQISNHALAPVFVSVSG
jgi:hypothetical protein